MCVCAYELWTATKLSLLMNIIYNKQACISLESHTHDIYSWCSYTVTRVSEQLEKSWEVFLFQPFFFFELQHDIDMT